MYSLTSVYTMYSVTSVECEMRPLLVQHLQAVTGEGLLDSLLPHLLSTGYKDRIHQYNKVSKTIVSCL